MKIAIIGAGWAGMAAALELARAGQDLTVFEAGRSLGGRARAIGATLPDGTAVTLDNGQHILIGAYTETLRLMRLAGVDPDQALLRLPLTLLFPDGAGLRLPRWPAPLDALGGIVGARGWGPRDKLSLLRAALRWRLARFACDASLSVAQLCQDLSPRVMRELIEPLCVSALNTPPERASAQVFLRVMQDALFGVPGSSNLLLPRTDLSALFPAAAARWISARGASIRLGTRVQAIEPLVSRWQIDDETFDRVILATPAHESIRILQNTALNAAPSIADRIHPWTDTASALRFEAITTVYAWARGATLPRPMLTLRSSAEAPAQFAFDRGQLGGPAGLLALVVSASSGERADLQARVLRQARQQLGLELQPVQTIVEKRATFACTPGLRRPPPGIAPGLLACGDHVQGPYPATLEGAVRSGRACAAQALGALPMDSP